MLIIADNLTASRRGVRRAIEARDGETISRLCQRIASTGADWIDINPGFLSAAKRREVWRFLVETVEGACDVRLVIDGSDARTMAVALDFCTRPPVLNMVTAAPERLGPTLDLVASHASVDLVCGTMTTSPPPTLEERLELAALIVSEANARGIENERLLIDPLVLPLALTGGEQQAAVVVEFIRAVGWSFDPIPRSLIGISNLMTKTAGARSSRASSAFLAAAWGAGLSAVLVDVFDHQLMDTIELCQVFRGEKIFSPTTLDRRED
mgnify:CR=1 FL=1